MTKEKISLLLHPIRLRIIGRLSAAGPQTTSDLQNHLPDIPQATMYRQIQMLLKAEIIQIHEQRQIRGTLEKVYILSDGGESVQPDQIQKMSKEEHLSMFTTFAAKLIDDYNSYLQLDTSDPLRDGVSARQVSLWMNDTEFEDFVTQLKSLFSTYTHATPGNGRRLRTMTNVIIPIHLASDQSPDEGGTENGY